MLEVAACVVLSASLGIAAGAVRPGSRGEDRGTASPRAPVPRQEVYRSAGDGSCSGAVDEAMLLVPAGTYRAFFKREGKAVETPVAPFRLDRFPVTREAFADFVRSNPAWRRSRVNRLFAEEAYLTDFVSDTEPGGVGSAPATFVSWFAARAYCACQGKRLATLAEWERAASPEPEAVAGSVPSRAQVGRLAFAMGGASRAPGSPEFGSVWEWTEDFDGAPVSGRASDAADSNLFCGAGVRAADATDYGGFLRYSFRSSLRAAYTLKNLGFRCARDER
jgi:formylglycine-generating enzyme required for sulfatase activity